MNVSLTPELKALIEEKVESGDYRNASEVVREALRVLDERDRFQRLRAEVMKGVEQMERGEVVLYTPELLDQIRQQAIEDARAGRPVKDAVKP